MADPSAKEIVDMLEKKIFGIPDQTAQQLAIAREIFIEGRKISDSPDREVERIASIIAKHQEPASERDGELRRARADQLEASLKNLRRYIAVESNEGGCRRIGLAFDGSIMGFEFDESYQPWELLEMMEKWLHEKIDAALAASEPRKEVS